MQRTKTTRNFAPTNNNIKTMKKRLLSIMAILGTMCCTAQALTLDECRQLARDNYPAIKQYGLVAAAKDYDMSNASKGWLPKISVQAGAYGFTNILDSESMIGKMGLNMDNYVVSGNVTVQQTVYDGGRIAAGRQAVAAKSAVETNQTDVALYNIKVRAEEIFFGILIIDGQLQQNAILQNDLQVSIKTVEGMMRSGIANQTDLDALQVELVNARQQHDTYEASRTAYLRMLSTFIGKELESNTSIEMPSMPTEGNGSDGASRPEMSLYASQDLLLDAQRRQLNSTLLPSVNLMGIGLWHTKVTDMVNSGMLLGGLTVSWNVGALYTRKNDLRKLDVQREQNDVQRKTFLFHNKLQRQETDGTVTALRKQLASDDEIVKLREGIRRMADRKVAAGTESINELVRDINAVNKARSQRAIHEVQLLKALYAKRSLNGEM